MVKGFGNEERFHKNVVGYLYSKHADVFVASERDGAVEHAGIHAVGDPKQ